MSDEGGSEAYENLTRIHLELLGVDCGGGGACAGLCGQPTELLLCEGRVLGAGARQAMEAHALEGKVCAFSLDQPLHVHILLMVRCARGRPETCVQWKTVTDWLKNKKNV